MPHRIGKNNERNRANRKSKIERKYPTYKVLVPHPKDAPKKEK
jgi:hypothetical protein